MQVCLHKSCYIVCIKNNLCAKYTDLCTQIITFKERKVIILLIPSHLFECQSTYEKVIFYTSHVESLDAV